MIDMPEKSKTHALLYELAESLSSLVIREHQILQDELNQVGSLVEDAVQEMGRSFRELNTCVTQQTSLVKQINAGDHEEKISELTDQVNSYASNMKRVLQFDDIVQQLAGHAGERIAQMQQLFTVLDKDVAILKATEMGDGESLGHMRDMLENIGKFRQLLEKENPVKQGSMVEGGIELF